jgi:hypothetical protein
VAFRLGGERLRLGIVELGATSQNQHRRAEHTQPAPLRPPQPHSCQITDMSVAVRVMGVARLPHLPAKLCPAQNKARIGTAKAPLKSPIRSDLPLPWHE